MSAPIDVVFCVDDGFVVPLAVSLASLDAASGSDVVTVHVLHRGLAEQTRANVTRALTSVEVRWVAVDEARVAGAHYSEFLTSASLYRLLIGDILPGEIERVVYLDADTVVTGSLAALGHADLGAATIGAVREAQSPWAAGPLGPPWRELGLDPAAPYFNSGVLAVDLERWRSGDIGRRSLEVLRRIPSRWGDQDALNAVLAGDWAELPRRWNLQSADVRGEAASWALWRPDVEAALADPAVIHFTERDKPWLAGSQHPHAARWYEHLDRTHWSGWRPSAARPSAIERWGRTLVRTVRDQRKVSTFPK